MQLLRTFTINCQQQKFFFFKYSCKSPLSLLIFYRAQWRRRSTRGRWPSCPCHSEWWTSIRLSVISRPMTWGSCTTSSQTDGTTAKTRPPSPCPRSVWTMEKGQVFHFAVGKFWVNSGLVFITDTGYPQDDFWAMTTGKIQKRFEKSVFS